MMVENGMPIAANAPSYCSTSLPHRPHASTRSSASSAPIAGRGNSSITSRCSPTRTMAFADISLRTVSGCLGAGLGGGIGSAATGYQVHDEQRCAHDQAVALEQQPQRQRRFAQLHEVEPDEA